MRILVTGGGIAGLTCAIALRQRGIACRVFEAGERVRDQGAGLMLGANALEVLRRLDLLDAVRSAGFALNSLGIWRSDGKALQVTNAEEWESHYGHRTLSIHRNALHRVLLTALDPECVRYGRRAVEIAQGPESISLRFEDGIIEEGDLLIGADGLRSSVRTALFGPTKYRYAGETSWRGISDHVVTSGPRVGSVAEIWGLRPGHRFGFCPISDSQTYFFATSFTPAGGRDKSHEAALAELRKSFADYVPEVLTLLQHTLEKGLIRTDIFDFPPLKRWHSGRVVLVGDAAHATTPNLGQGACQAIESAYVLAEQLSRLDYSQALRAYEAIRMEKAHFVTRMSWRFGKMVDMPGPLGRWLRYRLIPRVPKAATFKQMDRIYRLNF